MPSFAKIADLERASKKSEKELVHYFKPIDKGSSMPHWYYTKILDEEQEWIRRAERQLKDDLVPKDNVRTVKGELEARRRKVKEILAAHQEVREAVEKDKDKAAKRYKELEGIIKEYQPKRDELFHKPTRVIDPHEYATVTGHMNNIVKEYKILGRMLGENTNPERLRA